MMWQRLRKAEVEMERSIRPENEALMTTRCHSGAGLCKCSLFTNTTFTGQYVHYWHKNYKLNNTWGHAISFLCAWGWQMPFGSISPCYGFEWHLPTEGQHPPTDGRKWKVINPELVKLMAAYDTMWTYRWALINNTKAEETVYEGLYPVFLVYETTGEEMRRKERRTTDD